MARKARHLKIYPEGVIIAKLCGTCKTMKRLRDFHKHKDKLGGADNRCKTCNKANHLAWVKINRDEVRTHSRKYRTMKRYLKFDWSVEEERLLMKQRCILTDKKDDIHGDHFIALATGHGGTYEANMIPLSSSLNTSKTDKNPFEWARTRDDIDPYKWEEVVSMLAEKNGLTPIEFKDFVYWCYGHRRSISEVKQDPTPSIELWRRAKCIAQIA
ncbi:hypothetical protein [Thermoactinomyces sp. DSM 45892]|uniref:hypothetical protein n=1 Tax=Thermoactinomyces sp. DSM 45892 TaxID=1882753 RepID=UPI000898AB85|nr:hypothetical protein [Thermoactinomyces sp. DSM 45892]SDZ06283.1 hypothetical protein SAMN05444416_112128 [Thermoactinomyces sp. DSM 45892]